MSDYTLYLDCGCTNWCRCASKRGGYVEVHGTRTFYACNSCGAVVYSTEGHNLWHKNLS